MGDVEIWHSWMCTYTCMRVCFNYLIISTHESLRPYILRPIHPIHLILPFSLTRSHTGRGFRRLESRAAAQERAANIRAPAALLARRVDADSARRTGMAHFGSLSRVRRFPSVWYFRGGGGGVHCAAQRICCSDRSSCV